ncbi:MAG: hypothetical protein AAB407_02450 [Patescibacteria group bacterium]
MLRFFSIFLSLSLFLSPFSAFAEETFPAVPLEIPIYLFADSSGGLLGITPLTEDIFLWAYLSSDTLNPSGYTLDPHIDATTTEHILSNGVPVATIVTGTGNPTVSWNAQDHLKSTSIVTDSNANITEEVEYTAFGSLKNDVGTTIEKRKYTSHEHDADALDYTYAKARYLNTDWGRFLSEDPAFRLL